MDASRGHIHGNGSYPGSRRTELSPERLKRIGSFPFPDEDHGATLQIENDGQIPMAFANADLIDGDPLQPAQLRAGKAPFEIAFLDVFDHIPAGAQVPDHISDRHPFGQFEGITFKGLGVASAWGCKR